MPQPADRLLARAQALEQLQRRVAPVAHAGQEIVVHLPGWGLDIAPYAPRRRVGRLDLHSEEQRKVAIAAL